MTPSTEKHGHMKNLSIFFLLIILTGCITPERIEKNKTGPVESIPSAGTIEKPETVKKSNILLPGEGFGDFILNRTDLDYFENHRNEIVAYKEMGFWFEFNKSNILSLIGTLSSGVKTSKGVKVGDTEDEVLKQYGKPDKKEFEKKVYPKEYPGFDSMFDYILFYRGILFYINGDTVEAIAVYSAGFLDA